MEVAGLAAGGVLLLTAAACFWRLRGQGAGEARALVTVDAACRRDAEAERKKRDEERAALELAAAEKSARRAERAAARARAAPPPGVTPLSLQQRPPGAAPHRGGGAGSPTSPSRYQQQQSQFGGGVSRFGPARSPLHPSASPTGAGGPAWSVTQQRRTSHPSVPFVGGAAAPQRQMTHSPGRRPSAAGDAAPHPALSAQNSAASGGGPAQVTITCSAMRLPGSPPRGAGGGAGLGAAASPPLPTGSPARRISSTYNPEYFGGTVAQGAGLSQTAGRTSSGRGTLMAAAVPGSAHSAGVRRVGSGGLHAAHRPTVRAGGSPAGGANDAVRRLCSQSPPGDADGAAPEMRRLGAGAGSSPANAALAPRRQPNNAPPRRRKRDSASPPHRSGTPELPYVLGRASPAAAGTPPRP